LAKYTNIVLICILINILFLSGYLYDYLPLFTLMQYINFKYYINNLYNESLFLGPLIEGLLYSLTLGIKSCIIIFVFI
jgi:NADH:ubiquinone oxidoreductase subunit H